MMNHTARALGEALVSMVSTAEHDMNLDDRKTMSCQRKQACPFCVGRSFHTH